MDLNFLVSELKALEDSRIDKIYQPEKNLIVFSLYKTNSGKKLLRVNVGKSIFITEEKEDFSETLGFGMFLRKHLDGYFLSNVEQLKPERIIKFTFKIKDEVKNLYVEFFGGGNAILCNDNYAILNFLEQHDFRERSVRPKLKYAYPMSNFNVFDLKENNLSDLFKNSNKESVIVALATGLGLGGLYAEEVCLLSNIDKTLSPKGITEKQSQTILNSIKKLINHKIDAKVILENENAIDFAPFDFLFYSDKKYEKKSFETFNESINYFYSQFKEIKETEHDKKLQSLTRIIQEQMQTIEDLKKEEIESREKAELIYHKYHIIKEILDELNKASKTHSWKEIKEKVKGHKIIKELNDKDRKVVVEI